MNLPWPLPLWNTLHLRLYGAAELGIRTTRGEDDDLPRTQYVGGELFVGVDVVGDGRISVSQLQDRRWYDHMDVRFPALIRDAAWRAPFDREQRHGGHCEITDKEQAAAFLVSRDHTARVIARLDNQGDTVVIALTSTSVIVTGSEDEAGIRFILDRAAALVDDGAELMSIHPLVWRNAQWLPFDWRGDFPHLASRIDAVIRRVGVLQYTAQAPALERRGVVVATAELIEGPDGTVTTRAIWRQRTRALLPVVDDVVVEDFAGRRTTMSMPAFVERAGPGVRPADVSPMRYEVMNNITVRQRRARRTQRTAAPTDR